MQEKNVLKALADKQAITELIYRYCRSVDRLDIPLGHSIWHEDAVADYGKVYQGSGKGVIDLVCQQHRHALYHSHQIANILIELNGDSAGSESYCTASLRIKDGESVKQISVWSRYIDQWSHREGRWGLDKRQAIIDFDEIREVTPLGDYDVGKRDRIDPSYSLLQG